MDLNLSSPSSIALIIVAFFTFTIMAIQSYNNKKLPPGPRRLPIIGNIHQLLNPLPHRCLAKLAKKHGAIMYLKLRERPCIVVSTKQAAEQVFRGNDLLLAQRPVSLSTGILSYNSKGILFSPYGDHWSYARKICVHHLTKTKQVESLRSARETAVSRLVESIASGGQPVNLSKMLYSVTTSIISMAAFGDTCKPVEAFTLLVPRIVKMFLTFSIAEFFPSVGVLCRFSGVRGEATRLKREIGEVLDSIIAEYREKPTRGKDLLGVLLNLEDEADHDGFLSKESIRALLSDLFLGGIETSATTMEWTMSVILKHPEVLKKVQKEVRETFSGKTNIDETSLQQLKYMNAVIKETLRLHPSSPILFPRETRGKLAINGYEFGPKTVVVFNAWAIGRDPQAWTDAETFRPERFLETGIDFKGKHLEFIPFGLGRRICPGMMFGMNIVELTLANLLYHFNWELPDGLESSCLNMDEIPGATVRRKHDLCLIATQYRP